MQCVFCLETDSIGLVKMNCVCTHNYWHKQCYIDWLCYKIEEYQKVNKILCVPRWKLKEMNKCTICQRLCRNVTLNIDMRLKDYFYLIICMRYEILTNCVCIFLYYLIFSYVNELFLLCVFTYFMFVLFVISIHRFIIKYYEYIERLNERGLYKISMK